LSTSLLLLYSDLLLLSSSLRDLRHQTSSYALDLAQQISRAAEGQASVHPAITRRSNIGGLERSIDFVREGLAGLRRDNEKSAQFFIQFWELPADSCNYLERERLQMLRESLASRRRTLAQAKLLPSPLSANASPPSLISTLSTNIADLQSLSAAIARARSGLVQELVEVFNVVEVGGRPPVGGKAGTKGEWTIGGLVLPVPGDMRRKFRSFPSSNPTNPTSTYPYRRPTFII
jgi:hypothetical protein